MSKFHPFDNAGEGCRAFLFSCPGCGMSHVVYVERPPGDPKPKWQWNGSVDAPTLAPSVRVRWRVRDDERVCHSFIVDGKIQYLADCTHGLAGQTVELDEWHDT